MANMRYEDQTRGDSIHQEPHPYAGKTVRLKSGEEYRLEDWWDRLGMGSWMVCRGNLACLSYAMRIIRTTIPDDNEVVYGKIGAFGHLIHASELDLSD